MAKEGYLRRIEASVFEDGASLARYEAEDVEQVKSDLDLDRDPTLEELAQAAVVPDTTVPN